MKLRFKYNFFYYIAPLIIYVFIFTGCSHATLNTVTVSRNSPEPVVGQCEELLNRTIEDINNAGVRDSQAVPVAGFPYLRANRFLAGFVDRTLEDDAFNSWLDRLQDQAQNGFMIELANLAGITGKPVPGQKRVSRCIKILRDFDFELHAGRTRINRKKLKPVVNVPDVYQDWKRTIGLYGLTSQVVSAATEKLYDEIAEGYGKPVAQENPVSYYPRNDAISISTRDIEKLLQEAYYSNPLDVPLLSEENQERLFKGFAPVLVIDTLTDDDRIGAPQWSKDSETPVINTQRPVVYHYTSYTNFHGQVLLQLNYVFWFPARPKTSFIDYLGGKLDGLTWRVTLNEEGEVLAYDSIHNCGCYHLFFPTPVSCMKQTDNKLEERAFSPQSVPTGLSGSNRVHLYLAHTSHYIDRVTVEQVRPRQTAVEYNMADYDILRSIPRPDGTKKSMFGEDGVVPGTQRLERFFIWPMGIPNAGAMRQQGHHATAFYGKRHFDDDDIIARYFQLKENEVCF